MGIILRSRLRGSSPLARGLRAARRPARGGGGIIPARAGFTQAVLRLARCREDHPRSRGVYDADNAGDADDWGSSPLARGLRGDVGARDGRRRIIPARAGFTPCPPPPPPPTTDHPRSRGVYGVSGAVDEPRLGSSPLARGLLLGCEAAGRSAGIIPARAGFTATPGRVAAGCPDHPRSRGVYNADDALAEANRGSSPLARGLPVLRRVLDRRSGIIPARAGFTPHGPTPVCVPGDHPRSRGVYVVMTFPF